LFPALTRTEYRPGYSLFRDSYGYSPGLFPENTVHCVSLYPKTRDEELNYHFAAEIAEKFALNIANGILKTDAIWNINVPNIRWHK